MQYSKRKGDLIPSQLSPPIAPKNYPDAWGTTCRWTPENVTPLERCRVLDPVLNRVSINKAQPSFAQHFPTSGVLQIVNSRAGMIDAMPDVVPVVDRVPDCQGVIIATSMSGHGFGIGPGLGKAVANLAAGRQSNHDLSRFRFSRFTDGSRLVPGPSL